jgi:hypothetical protein
VSDTRTSLLTRPVAQRGQAGVLSAVPMLDRAGKRQTLIACDRCLGVCVVEATDPDCIRSVVEHAEPHHVECRPARRQGGGRR